MVQLRSRRVSKGDSKAEIVKADTKEKTPKKTPKKETPKEKTPKEAPKEKTPKKEAPKEKTPKKDTPKETTPKEKTPKEKTPLKRKAADDEASPSVAKKQKKAVEPKEAKTKESKKAKETKKPKEEKKVEEKVEEQPAQAADENEAAESDTEAQALAKIVDSDDDEELPDAPTSVEEIKAADLPKVSKDVVKAADSESGEPGVVYVGRIPRGFYEHQMREYFSQFGEVTKIRMSRNKATGQSKHFAFVEFAELGVAEIVAKTMDNYLLAGHLLKVKMVPKSQIHEKLWVGANRRFKKIPWNKMAGNKLKKPLTESAWTEKISKEEAKRNERAKKLSALGYEFEAPKLKGVHDVDETPAPAAIEEPKEEAPKAIEAAPKAIEAAPKAIEAAPEEVEAAPQDKPEPRRSTRAKKATKDDAPEEKVEASKPPPTPRKAASKADKADKETKAAPTPKKTAAKADKEASKPAPTPKKAAPKAEKAEAKPAATPKKATKAKVEKEKATATPKAAKKGKKTA